MATISLAEVRPGGAGLRRKRLVRTTMEGGDQKDLKRNTALFRIVNDWATAFESQINGEHKGLAAEEANFTAMLLKRKSSRRCTVPTVGSAP